MGRPPRRATLTDADRAYVDRVSTLLIAAGELILAEPGMTRLYLTLGTSSVFVYFANLLMQRATDVSGETGYQESRLIIRQILCQFEDEFADVALLHQPSPSDHAH